MNKGKIIGDLLKIIEDLQGEPTYNRFIDITQSLFYPINARVVLVMNKQEIRDLAEYLHFTIHGDGIAKNVSSPHGVIDYIIIDDTIQNMYGYHK